MRPRLTAINAAWDSWRAERDGASRVASRQRDRLAEMVRFVRSRSALYADLYRPVPKGVHELRRLPSVTKAQLMDRFDSWVTDPAVSGAALRAFVSDPSLVCQKYLDRYTVWTTSGTSGDPGIYIEDPGAMAIYGALMAVRAVRPWLKEGTLRKILQKGGRVATLFATGGHYASVVVTELVRRLHPKRTTGEQGFTVLTPLPELVGQLNEFQPSVMISYPTALALLAKEKQSGKLTVEPALLISGGEWLPPESRSQIALAFGCPLQDVYAASEFMGIAYSCIRERLHVNADWVILEPVDQDHQPVQPGCPSYTVLLTNLANRVQPRLRYDLGDSITVVPDPCPCGNPLPVIQVEGRQDEILAFPDPEGQAVEILPMAVGSVVERVLGVRRFQLVKTGPEVLRVRLEVMADAIPHSVWSSVKKNAEAYLRGQGLPHVRVELADGAPVADAQSGKFRQVWDESGGGAGPTAGLGPAASLRENG